MSKRRFHPYNNYYPFHYRLKENSCQDKLLSRDRRNLGIITIPFLHVRLKFTTGIKNRFDYNRRSDF